MTKKEALEKLKSVWKWVDQSCECLELPAGKAPSEFCVETELALDLVASKIYILQDELKKENKNVP